MSPPPLLPRAGIRKKASTQVKAVAEAIFYVCTSGRPTAGSPRRKKRRKKEVGEQYYFAQGIDTGGRKKKKYSLLLKI